MALAQEVELLERLGRHVVLPAQPCDARARHLPSQRADDRARRSQTLQPFPARADPRGLGGGGDQDGHFIEIGTGGELQNTNAGAFLEASLEVLGSNMVSATNIKYKFYARPGNDIPQLSKLYLYYTRLNN